MPDVSMLMPKMGESVMEATILQWLKNEGDAITEAESIVEVATDKVDSEIPTPYAGKLKKILVHAGQVIAIGKPIAIIETDTVLFKEDPETIQTEFVKKAGQSSTQMESKLIKTDTTPDYLPARSQTGRFYSPLVRYIAQQEGVSLEELGCIPGTGKNNRVTKADILAYLKPLKQLNTVLANKSQQQPNVLQVMPGDEVIPMDRIRLLVAERMVASKQIAPHVTSFIEADVTNLVKWKNQHQSSFKQKSGISLTYTPLLIEAIVRAIKVYPMINVAVRGKDIIKRKAINIGLAVALPDGNLIVPVIKHADQLSRMDLCMYVHDLVHRARIQQLKPDDVLDGTYTVSNIGSFKNLMGTPIIMQPQVAIMALGAIVKKPAVVTSANNDKIVVRQRMYLSHTYDHRVVDGALGGEFLQKVAFFLENFDMNSSF